MKVTCECCIGNHQGQREICPMHIICQIWLKDWKHMCAQSTLGLDDDHTILSQYLTILVF
jgi:hypothetical protein